MKLFDGKTINMMMHMIYLFFSAKCEAFISREIYTHVQGKIDAALRIATYLSFLTTCRCG